MIGSWTDCDLTDLGKAQAERITRRLAAELTGQKPLPCSFDLRRAAEA
jgi:broad specificity phosphatase PhoE